MNKTYSRINWENEPSTKTPLNEINLNRIDLAVDEIDNRVISLDTTKLNLSVANGMVKALTFDEATGIFTVEKLNGTTETIDTKLEKLAINFSYDPATEKLIITLEDGTTQEVDMSSLITQYEFENSDTVAMKVVDGKVKAEIVDGSITGDKLQPNYLADCQTAKNEAETAAESASTDAQRAEDAADRAESIVGIDYATTEQAGIVMPDGKTISVALNGLIKADVIRYGEEELIDDVTDLDSNVMYCQISNGSIVKAWIGVEGIAKPLSVGGSPTPKYSIAAWAATLEMEYATLAEIPLSDMNLLMNRHVSADYFVEWYKTDNSMLEQFLASDIAMECIGKWDYICDKLFAIPGAKSALLASDRWKYILKDKVPIMTSNTTPYGVVSGTNSPAVASGSEAYRCFDGNESTQFALMSGGTSDAFVQYKFANPINVSKVEYYVDYGAITEITLKILYSDDGANWNEVPQTYSVTQNIHNYLSVDDYGYHLYWRIQRITNVNKSGVCNILQFYGRALNVSVPKMTSNTEPKGEASASSVTTLSHLAGRMAFRAFAEYNASINGWLSNGRTNEWLEYRFDKDTCVKMLMLGNDANSRQYPFMVKNFDMQVFDAESNTYVTLKSDAFDNSAVQKIFYEFENGYFSERYRLFCKNNWSSSSSDNIGVVMAQFYGVDYSELTTIPLTLTVEGAKGDDITITNASGEIVSNVIFGAEETSKEVTIDIVEGADYTFTSSVAKATDGSGANYSKMVALSEDNLIDITTRLIPNMTSNTTPSGVASASSYDSSKGDTHAPFRAFTDVRDFSIRWHSQNTQNANMTEYIGYAFASKRKVDGFSFTRSTDSNQRDYTVELRASNDETTWVTLHSAAISKSQAEWRISFSNDVAYKYYRLYVIGASYYYNSNYAIEMANVQLYSVDKGVKVMPNGAIYWYGNECFDVSGGYNLNNFVKETNDYSLNRPTATSNNVHSYIRSKNKLNFGSYNSMKVLATANSTSARDSERGNVQAYFDIGKTDGDYVYSGDTATTITFVGSGYNYSNELLTRDISSYSGEHYFGVTQGFFWSLSIAYNSKIFALWLE